MEKPVFKGSIAATQIIQDEATRKTRKVKRIKAGLMIALPLMAPLAENHLSAAGRQDVDRASIHFGRSTELTTSSTTVTTVFARAERATTTMPTPSTTKPTPTKPTGAHSNEEWTGLASYYTRAGCVGCNPERIMANGEPLDDNALTVAFNRAPSGTMLNIINVGTKQSVVAEVTDTGGFEKLAIPKIIDLSQATKNAIGCADTCKVRITHA